MEMVRTETLQAQGWEKWLSRIRFPERDKLYIIIPLASIIGSAIELARFTPPPNVGSGYAF
jgi:hypothetical protein